MRVLVTGGRDYRDRRRVDEVLSGIEDLRLVISGGSTGADRLAEVWAAGRGVALAVFPAHWTALGRPAGPRRNAWMILHARPDLVLAFPGGTGTANMVEQATRAGIPVRKIA